MDLDVISHGRELHVGLHGGALCLVAAHGAAEAVDFSGFVEERELVGDEPLGLAVVVGKELDDAEQGLSCGHDLFVVRAEFLHHARRENRTVGNADDLRFIGEATAFHEGRIRGDQAAIQILGEKKCAGQVIEKVPELSGLQGLVPFLSGSFVFHVSQSYTKNP